jgi:hypothetical protein
MFSTLEIAFNIKCDLVSLVWYNALFMDVKRAFVYDYIIENDNGHFDCEKNRVSKKESIKHSFSFSCKFINTVIACISFRLAIKYYCVQSKDDYTR